MSRNKKLLITENNHEKPVMSSSKPPYNRYNCGNLLFCGGISDANTAMKNKIKIK